MAAIKRPRPRSDQIGSDHGLVFSLEHDLFGKPASTFPDHALKLRPRHRTAPFRLNVAPGRKGRSYRAAATITGVPPRSKSRLRGPVSGGVRNKGGNAMAVPFDQRSDLIWFDGKLIPTAECKISVLTHGLNYARSVFEGERAYGRVVFEGTKHSERLKRSAEIRDFEIPYAVAEIEAGQRVVLERNNQKEAYVRPIAWRGSEQLGVSAQNNT